MKDERFRYITHDPELVAAFKDWQKRRKAWAKKIQKVAAKYGRKPVISTNANGYERFDHMSRKEGEPSWSRTFYAKTPWVLHEKSGFLQPRVSKPEGRKIQAEMEACGAIEHPATLMKGAPATYNVFSTPGIELGPGEDCVILTYGEKVRVGDHWKPILESTYWKMREEKIAKKKE